MDKELFIKMYKEFGNLKDTCNYLHISQEKVQKIRKVDDEFDAACRRTTLENYKKSKVPEGKREKQMKVFLEAYKSGKNFMTSLKESGITTHAFQEIKKTNEEFRNEYDKIKRSVGFNAVRQKRLAESRANETKVCQVCGQELPLTAFKFSAYKTCNECLKRRSEKKSQPEQNTPAMMEYKALRAKYNELMKLAKEYALALNTEKYMETCKEAQIIAYKMQARMQTKKNVSMEEYHIPV